MGPFQETVSVGCPLSDLVDLDFCTSSCLDTNTHDPASLECPLNKALPNITHSMSVLTRVVWSSRACFVVFMHRGRVRTLPSAFRLCLSSGPCWSSGLYLPSLFSLFFSLFFLFWSVLCVQEPSFRVEAKSRCSNAFWCSHLGSNLIIHTESVIPFDR